MTKSVISIIKSASQAIRLIAQRAICGAKNYAAVSNQSQFFFKGWLGLVVAGLCLVGPIIVVGGVIGYFEFYGVTPVIKIIQAAATNLNSLYKDYTNTRSTQVCLGIGVVVMFSLMELAFVVYGMLGFDQSKYALKTRSQKTPQASFIFKTITFYLNLLSATLMTLLAGVSLTALFGIDVGLSILNSTLPISTIPLVAVFIVCLWWLHKRHLDKQRSSRLAHLGVIVGYIITDILLMVAPAVGGLPAGVAMVTLTNLVSACAVYLIFNKIDSALLRLNTWLLTKMPQKSIPETEQSLSLRRNLSQCPSWWLR